MLESDEMKAHVQDGQVILDGAPNFPDGTRLRVALEEEVISLPRSTLHGERRCIADVNDSKQVRRALSHGKRSKLSQ